jgi:hypothetical protein
MNKLEEVEVKEQVLIDKINQKDSPSYMTNLNIYIISFIIIIILSSITVYKLKSSKKKKEISEKDLEKEHYQDYQKALKSLDRNE